ncbi:hypothetical protein BT96DRAFT_927906 [Gymnopus androsaceus JB14]|uniref:Uncharacterized protein n=1 Tax=Gymnopus androsaceus JB14 TaxID=1447944 RepID=A0A6A4GM94_9AGAR|nr:hypothetical protein BT96DRAFT_927906 [Gymnopus androsaceus JB14]
MCCISEAAKAVAKGFRCARKIPTSPVLQPSPEPEQLCGRFSPPPIHVRECVKR